MFASRSLPIWQHIDVQVVSDTHARLLTVVPGSQPRMVVLADYA